MFMRTILILFLFTFGRSLAADSAKSADVRPALSYPSQAAISQWATNAFGGSRIDLYKHNAGEVLVVWRSFTSGVTTSDLCFFVQSRNRWKLALWYPVRGEGLKTEERGDGIDILYYDAQQNKWARRLSISYEALFDIGA